MFVSLTDAVIVLSTVFVCGSLSAFVASSFILRRYVSLKSYQSLEYELKLESKRQLIVQQRQELEVKTKAIQKIVYDSNHKGIWPLCKSLLGMLDLLRMSTADNRSREYIDKSVTIVRQIENEVMKEVREIESLQE